MIGLNTICWILFIFAAFIFILAVISRNSNNPQSEDNTNDNSSFPLVTSPEDKTTETSNQYPEERERINFYNKCTNFPNDFIVLDTETTGFNPSSAHLIQIACIKVNNNEIVDTFNEYIKPPVKIPQKIQTLTGITNEMVEDCKNIYDVLPELVKFVGDNTLICHNASFDMSFIQTNLNAFGLDLLNNDVLDTLYLSRKCIRDVENHKLETLKNYLNIETVSHNALNDCEVTLKVYQYCQKNSSKNIQQTNNSTYKENQEIIELSPLEADYYSIVKTILSENDKDISLLKLSRTSIYFDIKLDMWNFLRFKTTKKLKYWLIETTEDEILSIDNSACFQKGKNDERKCIRLFLDTPQDIVKYSNLILNQFDKTLKCKLDYDQWVAEGKPTYTHYKSTIRVNSDGTCTIEHEKY